MTRARPASKARTRAEGERFSMVSNVVETSVAAGGAAINDTGPGGKLLLRAVEITKRFGGLVAVNKVDFTIPRGAIVSLIGPNGAGKTTFFNTITGLYKPTTGSMWFNGHNIVGLNPAKITALGVARTFQNIRLFSNMTTLENVLVGEHCRLSAGVFGAIFRPPQVVREE